MMALLYTSWDLVGSNVVGSRSIATVSWPPLTGLPAADVAGWVAAAAGAVVGFAAGALPRCGGGGGRGAPPACACALGTGGGRGGRAAPGGGGAGAGPPRSGPAPTNAQ